MNNEGIVEELNTILRGTYMGIRSFEQYIQKVEDEQLKSMFQSMQIEAKHSAEKLSERIQNLNGVPAHDEGVSGTIHSFMHKMTLPDTTNGMIQDAIEGNEKYGVGYAEEVVRGDLDPVSRQLVEEVLDTNRRHAEQLKQLLY